MLKKASFTGLDALHISAREYEELVAFCQARVQDPECARELAQECFARIVAMHRAGRASDDRRGLLRLIALHLVVDLARRESVRARHECGSRRESLAQAMPAYLQPEALCAFSEQLHAYLAVIGGLPLRCRQVFCLHAFDELPGRQISERMGISLSMVNKHIGSARRACAAHRVLLEGGRPRRGPASAP